MMRQIATIEPGMRRQDLTAIFRADGGLTSVRGPQRFVRLECLCIKIDVQFHASGDKPMAESPDDVIETVSKPYLEYPFAD